MRFIAIDIATTGIHPGKHRIVEITGVEISDGTVRNEACWHRSINHGSHPGFSEVADDFLQFIKGAILLIHNANKVLPFIAWEMALIQRAINPKTKVINYLGSATFLL